MKALVSASDPPDVGSARTGGDEMASLPTIGAEVVVSAAAALLRRARTGGTTSTASGKGGGWEVGGAAAAAAAAGDPLLQPLDCARRRWLQRCTPG